MKRTATILLASVWMASAQDIRGADAPPAAPSRAPEGSAEQLYQRIFGRGAALAQPPISEQEGPAAPAPPPPRPVSPPTTPPAAAVSSDPASVAPPRAKTPPPPPLPKEEATPAVEDVKPRSAAELAMAEGMELYAENAHQPAIPMLELALRKDPTLLPAWEALGWCYWQTGRTNDTVRLWEQLLTVAPDAPLPYNLLAKLEVMQGRLDRAIALNQKSLHLDPTQFQVRYDMARAMRWNGDVHGAIELLSRAANEDPNRLDVARELARALTFGWAYEEALPLWQRLLAVAPGETEYLANEALCLLHTNHPEEARERAGRVLATEPQNLIALQVMADSVEFSATPEEALPYLRQWMAALSPPQEKETVRVRLIRLLIRLHRLDPKKQSLAEPIALTRERILFDAQSIDAQCLLGELLLLAAQLPEAEMRLRHVLEQMNENNLRAKKGLFEVFLASRQFAEARRMLDRMAEFNPCDPYLYYYWARLESTRGDYYQAHRALDRLEAAGRGGAIPVLLYHGLTPSAYFVDALSVERFRDHIRTLQAAGFTLMKAEDLPKVLTQEKIPSQLPGHAPTPAPRPAAAAASTGPALQKLIVVDFDDGRRDSMRYGTQVAQELNVVFSHHIPVGYVARNHPFICTWNQLIEYGKTGRWDFGSHFMDAAILARIAPGGKMGHALPNRIWLDEQKRMETTEEYDARLKLEFSESKRILKEKLGGAMNFVSYPFGDIGQEVGSNADRPVERILRHAATQYEVGFIQSSFGFAVAGDDPLLYQRHEIERWQTGELVVQHVYNYHPVFLARRMRAEFAALEGRQYLALRTMKELEQDGYPEALLAKLRTYVEDRLAGKMASPAAGRDDGAAPSGLRPGKPFAGVEAMAFADNQDRSSQRWLGLGGLHLTPQWTVEGKVGPGAMQQDFVEAVTAPGGATTNRTENIELDEWNIGVRTAYVFPRGLSLAGSLTQRTYSGSSTRTVTAASLETAFRPVLASDVLLRYERDGAPSAKAVADGVTYDQAMAVGVYRLTDWWDLVGTGAHVAFSDDNTREHLQAGTTWLVHPRSGFRLGLRYAYTSAEEDRSTYWTPYQLSRYFVEGGFQGNYLRAYYNLRLRLGTGREGVRPEEKEAYAALAARAQEQNFDAGPPPKNDWETLFGVSFSTRIPIKKQWTLNGEISYNRLPNYNEWTALGGLRYSF